MLKTIHAIEGLSQWVGKAFGWCIMILTLGISYEVFVRYVLNSPTIWAFDVSLQMYGGLFMMAGAYALAQDAHVRGDVLYRLFPVRVQARLDAVLYILFFFPGMLALAWFGADIAMDAWRYKEKGFTGLVQVYGMKTLIPAAGFLLIVQGVAEFMRCLIAMRTGKWPERIDDVRETEDMLTHVDEDHPEMGIKAQIEGKG